MDELRRKGLREDERGLRLGDARHAGRLLRADRRPSLRHHLVAAGSVDARQADHDADRGHGAGDIGSGRDQANAALANGEITEDELKEMAIFLTHYLGFPLGSKLDGVATKVINNRRKAAEKGSGEDKKANVNAALNMHSGSSLDDK